MRSFPRLVVLPGVLLACLPASTPIGDLDTTATGGGGPGSTSSTAGESSTGVPNPTTGLVTTDLPFLTTGSTGIPDPSTTTTGGGTTVADPTFATDGTTGEPIPCNLSLQDCPDGQKCSVYADSLGDLFQGMFKCVPLHPDPQPPHAACDVFSDPADGTDDCALGSICLFPDAEGIGECFAFCNDSQEPICSTPGDVCVGPFCQSCMWTYCDVHCDILDPNTCAAGEVCAPTSEGPWQCFFDSSGDAGAPGDPCTALNACDPGNICLEPAAVPGCTSDSGCCAPACDVNAQGPCPDDGSQCVPWYDEGLAPTPELAEVGVCRLP